MNYFLETVMFYDIFKQLCEEKGITPTKASAEIGFSKGSVSYWKKKYSEGTNAKPDSYTAAKIADYFGVSVDYLLECDPQHYPGVYHPVMRRVPLLGKVACGKPIYSPNYDDGFALINSDVIADFALEAKGDSMSGANICEGDVVFFAETEQVDNGQIAAVFVDNEVTLKRVYYYPEQNRLMLAAENPKYPPMVYTNEELNDIRIIGRAVAYQHIIKG